MDRERIELLVLGAAMAGKAAAREHRTLHERDFYHRGLCEGRYEAYRKILEALGDGYRLPESLGACGSEKLFPEESRR